MLVYRKIYSLFLGMKNMISAGGNFGYIAQNVATIYYIINRSPFGKSLNDNQKLYATALIDMYTFLSNGTFSPEDIAISVDFGKNGIVCIPPYSRQNDYLGCKEHRKLIYVTMQLEAMIFYASTNMNPNLIIDKVFSHKDRISDMISKTIEQGMSSPLYLNLFEHVAVIIGDIDFQNIVLSQNQFQGST